MVGQEVGAVEMEHLVQPTDPRRKIVERTQELIDGTVRLQAGAQLRAERRGERLLPDPQEIRGEPFVRFGVGVTEELAETAGERRARGEPLDGTAQEGPGRPGRPVPIAFETQGGVPTVTGEEVVAPGARQQDFHAAVAGGPAHRLGGEGGDVRGRLVQRPDHGVEVMQRLVAQGDVVQAHAQLLRHQPRIRMVVGEAFGRDARELRLAHGEAIIPTGVPERLAGEVGDGRRIDAAGEEPAQRHVRHQLTADRLAEIMSAGFRGLVVGERLDLLRVMRRREGTARHLAVGRPFQPGPGRHLADAPGRREVARRIEERKVSGHRGEIQRPVDAREIPECLELGSEGAALRRRGPVKRLHAGGVAGEEELALLREPGGEREDAVELRQAGAAFARQQVGEHLGVAAPAEDDAVPLEAGAQFAEIVDLAVEADDDPPAGVGHGLRAGGRQVEDGEAHVRQSGGGVMPLAAAVRAAMPLGAVHPPELTRLETPDISGDAAHGQAWPPRPA